MRIGLWPFWSQQDKSSGAFLPTCGNVKQLVALARELTRRGHFCRFAVPWEADWQPVGYGVFNVWLPAENPLQRLHWNVQQLRGFLASLDVLVTSSEYLSIPARAIAPDLPIYTLCNVRPDSELFRVAFDASSVVVAQSRVHREMLYDVRSSCKTTIWSMQYDEEQFAGADLQHKQNAAVFFPQRCSANNATHHLEFIEACRLCSALPVFADVTGFLRKEHPSFRYTTPATYLRTLCSSKVVVCLYDNGAASMTVREAARAGCHVVCPDTPGMQEVFGPGWPWYTALDAASIAAAIRAARVAITAPSVDVHRWSYQEGCRIAADEICQS